MQPDPPDVDRSTGSGPRPAPAETPTRASGRADDPVLAVPGSLHVTAATRDRMAAVLAASPPGTLGVVAPAAPLVPGGSVVSAAEWGLLEPVGTATRSDPDVVGAVLLRPGVGHEVLADHVRIDPAALTPATALRIDPGSVASRPPVAVTADARPDGRPPFRWRPVVLFLGGTDGESTAAEAGRLVDALVPLDVEARLAVADPAPVLIGTQPCRPTEASVRALAPDVIVALDTRAQDLADRWSPSRATSVVLWAPELGDGIELIPWTIGIAQGRRRARIGPDADPRRVAELIARLAAAPQPIAPDPAPADLPSPTDGPGPTPVTAVRVEVRASGRPVADPTAFRVVAPPSGPGPLLAGLADHLAAAGHDVAHDDTGGRPTATGVITLTERPLGLGATRAVLVGRGSPPLPDPPLPDPGPPGTDPAWTGRAAIVGDHAGAARIRALGGHPIVVPTLVPRADAEELLATAEHRVRPPEPRIGWVVGSADAGTGEHGGWSRAVRATLDVEPDLRIDLVGVDPADPELAALGPEQAVTVRPAPDPSRLASWTAQVWMPPEGAVARTGDASPLVRASLAGVPTVLAAPDRAASGGLALAELTIDDPSDPEAWAAAVVGLLDDDHRARCAGVARSRALALHGPDAAGPTIARLLGWLTAVAPA